MGVDWPGAYSTVSMSTSLFGWSATGWLSSGTTFAASAAEAGEASATALRISRLGNCMAKRCMSGLLLADGDDPTVTVLPGNRDSQVRVSWLAPLRRRVV